MCRYWRDSIISTPELWTLISNEWEGLSALSLERSKAAPLEIWLRIDDIADPHFSDLLIPYTKNTKILRVNSGPPIGELAQALPGFPQSMPDLQFLSLTCGHPVQDRPIDSFGPLTPTLKYLALYNVPLYPLFLRLRALTTFILNNYLFDLHPDTLLDFLEENKSLESAELGVMPIDPSLWSLWPRTATRNRLQNLSIRCHDYGSARFLLCNIPLQRGAHLAIVAFGAGLGVFLRGISTAHLLNLPSPAFMECQPNPRAIRLIGPNGRFSFDSHSGTVDTSREFPLLPLTDVREFHLKHRRMEGGKKPPKPLVFCPPLFPALEMFAVTREADMLRLLSPLFLNPSSSPSLKTLAFLDCDLTNEFMGELAQFIANRRNTTSVWLHRVAIVNSNGNFPSPGSIGALREDVPVVDVRMAEELPTGLM